MPKRPGRLTLLLLVLIGLLSASAPSIASAEVRVAGGQGESGQPQPVRPFTIRAFDWSWSRLSWTTWTDVEANGSGSYFAYCIGEPDCPDDDPDWPMYFEYPVLVHLYGAQNCSGKQTFTRIQTTFTAEPPYWGNESVITDRLNCPRPPSAQPPGGREPRPAVLCRTFDRNGYEDHFRVAPKRCTAFKRGAEANAEGVANMRAARWRWGSGKATAKGKLFVNMIGPVPARFRLSKAVTSCTGRPVFSKLNVRYHIPPGPAYPGGPHVPEDRGHFAFHLNTCP